jgi:hypothetical protein
MYTYIKRALDEYIYTLMCTYIKRALCTCICNVGFYTHVLRVLYARFKGSIRTFYGFYTHVLYTYTSEPTLMYTCIKRALDEYI